MSFIQTIDFEIGSSQLFLFIELLALRCYNARAWLA